MRCVGGSEVCVGGGSEVCVGGGSEVCVGGGSECVREEEVRVCGRRK